VFEPEQQAAELVLPAKHTLNGVEPLLEDRFVKEWLAAAFGGLSASGIGIDVRHHAAVEYRLPVSPAVVNAIQAHDSSSEIEADGTRDPRHHWQRLTEEWRFVPIAGRGYEWRDDVAVPVAKGHDLVTFDLLVPAEADVVAALLIAAVVVPSP